VAGQHVFDDLALLRPKLRQPECFREEPVNGFHGSGACGLVRHYHQFMVSEWKANVEFARTVVTISGFGAELPICKEF
jgi:hypothetical protein